MYRTAAGYMQGRRKEKVDCYYWNVYLVGACFFFFAAKQKSFGGEEKLIPASLRPFTRSTRYHTHFFLPSSAMSFLSFGYGLTYLHIGDGEANLTSV